MKEIRNDAVLLPTVEDENRHVFHIFPILCANREALQKHLSAEGIETMVHYPIPPHRQEALKELSTLELPITELIHDRELSLPCNPGMSDDEVTAVIEAVNRYRA